MQLRTGSEPGRFAGGDRLVKRRTVGFEDRHKRIVEDVVDEHDLDSFAEGVRAVIEQRDELQEDVDDLQETVADLEDELEHARARRDEMRDRLAAVQDRQEDVQELVEYVEQERTLQERKAQAGLMTRARWWLVGMDEDPE